MNPNGMTPDLCLIIRRGINLAAHHVHELARDKGWWDTNEHGQTRGVPECLALIHSEVSEALECWREGEAGPKLLFDPQGKPTGFASELADVVIRVMDLAEAEGVDLAQAILAKHAYNTGRPHRHGGKRA